MKILYTPEHDDQIDARCNAFASFLWAVRTRQEFSVSPATYFGYVVSGTAGLSANGFAVTMSAGAFFSWPGSLVVETEGLVVVFCRLGFQGLLSVGRTEHEGRLRYIDGCSVTVLASPPQRGDPMLNYLHFPPNTEQMEHTHSSLRLGVVARGSGFARYSVPPNGTRRMGRQLTQGAVFMIDSDEPHAFSTTDSSMELICYHPDSDWGPTDQNNPVLNRTHFFRARDIA